MAAAGVPVPVAAAPPPSPKATQRRQLWTLYGATFLDSAAFNILAAVTPAMMHSLNGGNLALTSSALARMSAVSALLEFVLNPVFGALSDCWGRLPFLYLSPAATFVLRAVVAWRPSAAAAVETVLLAAACHLLMGQAHAGEALKHLAPSVDLGMRCQEIGLGMRWHLALAP